MKFHPSSLCPHPLLICIALLMAASSIASAQNLYDFGDWISYRDTRGVRSIDGGGQEIFFATSGGILSYHLLKNFWYDPMAVGYGLTEAVDLGDPVLLFLDTETGLLWVANRTEVLQFNLRQERWKRVEQHLWPQSERVVNFGAGGDHVYIETIPEYDYDRWVLNYKPLPHPLWQDDVTRYVGDRDHGGFMRDMNPAETEDIRWRGVRSMQPLVTAQLGHTTIAHPPAGFPTVTTPHGWLWQFDGNLIDPRLRPYPIMDWYLDSYNRFWTAQWGAGILKVNLMNTSSELIMQGPAGNDIRTILVTEDAIWMGGANNGDGLGISRADRSYKSWSFIENRDSQRIRTTEVNEIAEWQNLLWFATEDGLLSYDKKNKWGLYVVQDNLYHNRVTALEPVGDELWIGTEDGLCVMNAEIFRIDRIPQDGLEMYGVTDIVACGDSIYVGSPVGLFAAAKGSRAFVFGSLDPGLIAEEVSDISVFENEHWLVTERGVMKYDHTRRKSDSWLATVWMKHTHPTCVCAMEKYVWVGTKDDGFYRYKKGSNEWLNYNTADGLLSNHVQTIEQDGDDLLIGTDEGLTRFYWNRPSRNK
ncbi:hypothetical protein EH220_00830 [bacterium]|nr:MAG: hypothetical protein EH220_00830 [bacterium]